MNRSALRIGLASLAMVAFVPGCGSRSDSSTPGSTAARAAISAALDAWKEGARPDELAVNSTPLHPVDFQWLAGVGLDDYEIVSEEPLAGGSNTTLFIVSLQLEPPLKPIRARYLVNGRSPIWVYREEDYARASNGVDRPAPTTKAGR